MQMTEDARKAKGFQEVSSDPSASSSGGGAGVPPNARIEEHRDDPRKGHLTEKLVAGLVTAHVKNEW